MLFPIFQTITIRDLLLEEFDDEIVNALAEKIEILTPAQFVFEYEEWDEGGRLRADICCEVIGGTCK